MLLALCGCGLRLHGAIKERCLLYQCSSHLLTLSIHTHECIYIQACADAKCAKNVGVVLALCARGQHVTRDHLPLLVSSVQELAERRGEKRERETEECQREGERERERERERESEETAPGRYNSKMYIHTSIFLCLTVWGGEGY